MVGAGHVSKGVPATRLQRRHLGQLSRLVLHLRQSWCGTTHQTHYSTPVPTDAPTILVRTPQGFAEDALTPGAHNSNCASNQSADSAAIIQSCITSLARALSSSQKSVCNANDMHSHKHLYTSCARLYVAVPQQLQPFAQRRGRVWPRAGRSRGRQIRRSRQRALKQRARVFRVAQAREEVRVSEHVACSGHSHDSTCCGLRFASSTLLAMIAAVMAVCSMLTPTALHWLV